MNLPDIADTLTRGSAWVTLWDALLDGQVAPEKFLDLTFQALPRETDEQLTSTGETLRKVLRLFDVLDGPPYNLVLHTAPLHERVDETFHWHWEIHPRLREIAGLELGTGLPVNPVSPEDAVDELLAEVRQGSGPEREGVVSALRSWAGSTR